MEKTIKYFKRELKKKHGVKCKNVTISDVEHLEKYNGDIFLLEFVVKRDSKHSVLFCIDFNYITTTFSILEKAVNKRDDDNLINITRLLFETLDLISDVDEEKKICFYKNTNYIMLDIYDDNHLTPFYFIHDEIVSNCYSYGSKIGSNPSLLNNRTKSARK